jgi:hypothetical protein
LILRRLNLLVSILTREPVEIICDKASYFLSNHHIDATVSALPSGKDCLIVVKVDETDGSITTYEGVIIDYYQEGQ